MRPLTTTFLLVRHGESEANAGGFFAGQRDACLTELGRAQAERLAAALRDAPIHAVYSSDLARARDTVAPLARALGLDITESNLLRERDMGAFAGVSIDSVRDTHPDIWAGMLVRDPDVAPPDGESHRELSARAARFLDGLAARHAGHTVVISSHGGLIQHLVRQLLGIEDLAVPLWVQTSNTGVTRIELYEAVPGVHAARLTYANRVLAAPGEPTLP
jgi:probable phosphoglycerate mutase